MPVVGQVLNWRQTTGRRITLDTEWWEEYAHGEAATAFFPTPALRAGGSRSWIHGG